MESTWLQLAMPSSKATLAAHLAKGRAVKAEKQAQLSSESAFEDLWGSLQSANARIAELENELAQKSAELAKLQTQLDKSTEQCSQLASGVALWKSKHEATYHELRMQRQTSNRGQDSCKAGEFPIQTQQIAKRSHCTPEI